MTIEKEVVLEMFDEMEEFILTIKLYLDKYLKSDYNIKKKDLIFSKKMQSFANQQNNK